MNREILFRGKRVDNGEWTEGYLYKTENSISYGDNPFSNCFIIPSVDSLDFNFMPSGELLSKLDLYHVIPETVGQYTWEEYPNGSKIFQGDIIERTDSNDSFEVIFLGNGYKALKVWDEYLGIDIRDRDHIVPLSLITTFKIKKAGTIHDKK